MSPADNNNRLGRYVREQREKRGLSGRALAAAAGVNEAWVHRLEHGRYASPDARLLVRLARVLEVEVADLYLAAGLPTGSGLPSMKPYLRAKYDLPELVIREIDEYVDKLIEQHDGKRDDDDRAAA